MARSVIIFVLVGLLAVAQAHEFKGDNTLELTTANYEDETSSGKVYFVAYFAPWCGHCKRLAPAFVELADKLADNKDIVIAYMDCTQHRDVCIKAEVKGYPTIKVVHKNEEYKTYRGARDVENMSTFVLASAKELLTESN